MAELSDLLGDVYGPLRPSDPDGAPVIHEPPAEQRVPSVPEWASDERLDAAFKDWTPTGAAEVVAQEVVSGEVTAEPASPAPLDDDLAAALSAALAAAPRNPAADIVEQTETAASLFGGIGNGVGIGNGDGVGGGLVEHTPVVDGEPVDAAPIEAPAPVEPEAPHAWRREDDDILPKRSRRRWFRRG